MLLSGLINCFSTQFSIFFAFKCDLNSGKLIIVLQMIMNRWNLKCLSLAFTIMLGFLLVAQDMPNWLIISLILGKIDNEMNFNRSSRNCVPKKNIIFLKTHKCASSTIQNILMRYGVQNELTFALPRRGNYFNFVYGSKFRASQVLEAPCFLDHDGRLRRKSFNILTHHTQFNYCRNLKIRASKYF